jgi:hypothetical protein
VREKLGEASNHYAPNLSLPSTRITGISH